MKHTQETDGGTLILRLSGQLMGGADSDQVRDAIQAGIERGSRAVLLDMSDVTWVNSTGLGMLISSHLAARQAGVSFRLMKVSKRIAAVLAVTRLNTVFEVYETEEEARRAATAAAHAPAPAPGPR